MSKKLLFDRDLSWLSFNYRVLLEADDSTVPLVERLRFVAIFSSNLDEFFRVRVANLRRLVEIDKKKINKKIDIEPESLLQQIQKEVGAQLKVYGKVLSKILRELKTRGLSINYTGRIPVTHQVDLNTFFKIKLMGYLRIQQLKKKSLFLDNRALYFVVSTVKSGEKINFILNIPSNKVSRFHTLKSKQPTSVYFIDDIIRNNLEMVFPGHLVEGCYSIKLNKDADLQIDDEYEGDLVQKIEKQIQKRNLGVPSRFLYDSSMPEELLSQLVNVLDLNEADLYAGGRYHNLNDFFQVSSSISGLEYEKQAPIPNKMLDARNSLFESIKEQDQILHFPYQSYNYILRFFNEAAIHPDVRKIDVTFYRMAENSMIGEALISAANNGKKVNVFMEVKARFDEENNLLWARKMEAAGINIHYSIPGLKVHAKAALITMKGEDGTTTYFGFYGTGNLNEGTAKIYCDHSLLTINPDMNKELKQVFDFLNSKKKPSDFKHLIVSQFGAPDRFAALIQREIDNHSNGLPAEIIIKLNNLEESVLIEKLYEAAKAGVRVTLIVRSICCLIPDTYGIRVVRVVDRYLEHARIFSFLNGGEEELYMGSSDWMTRNLHRRVEVTFPVNQEHIKKQVKDLLQIQLKDNIKAVVLDSKMNNLKIKTGKKPGRAQMDAYEYIRKLN
ncbi:MAG: polyphosphate kinase 1 [Cyclobacteriaceae bacterium]|nr:polyphosphate kinase 1 [Cyclobacteriaceae bacterium SS2]